MKAELYAEALLELGRNKNTEEIDILIEHLRALLQKKHLMRLFPKILKSLETAQKKKRDYLLLKTAKPISSERAKEIVEKYFPHRHPSSITHVLDASLIGGYQLETKDLRIDESYKQSLLTLYKTLLTQHNI